MLKTPAIVTAEEAISHVHSGDSIYLSAFGCTPEILIEELCRVGRTGSLRHVKLVHTILLADAEYTKPEYDGVFDSSPFLREQLWGEAPDPGI